MMYRLLGLLLLVNALTACRPLSSFDRFIQQSGTHFDLLIAGGTLIDGSGQPGYPADLLVRDGEIVYTGPVDSSKIELEQWIDARGKVVCPGFIDPHAHGDPLRTPAFENFLAQGVTTIALGQDGFSPSEADTEKWLSAWEAQATGPNILPFVGHSSLRELAGIGTATEVADEQLQRLCGLLEQALQAGCWGLTTGLEYVPGTYATETELLALARVVGQGGGLLMSHLRSEDDEQIEAALDELLRQGQYCRVQVSHIKVVYGKGAARARQILQKLHAARRLGVEVTADWYPYTASYTGIGIVFPAWAKAPHNYEQVKQQRRAELARYLRMRVEKRNGPAATLFGSGPYAGQTLAEVAAQSGKAFEEVLIELGPTGASGAYFVMDEALQATLFKDSLVMVCSDGSPGMRHPRAYGSFARVVETFVIEQKLLPLHEAIYKMSGLTAAALGLDDRGRIAPGMKADLLVFDPQAVRETATFEQPHQLAEGFEYVLVNGQMVKQGPEFTGTLPGKLLRKGGRGMNSNK